jgi:hypothetical protein
MVIDSQKTQELRLEAQVIRGVINVLRPTPSSVREYSTRAVSETSMITDHGHYLESPFPTYSMDYSLQRTKTYTFNRLGVTPSSFF